MALKDAVKSSTSTTTPKTTVLCPGGMVDGEQISRNEEDKQFAGHHPDLQRVCVVNCATGKRIIPNHVPDRLENECFEGQVMLMIRTPDCDDPKERLSTMGETPERISEYLRGKQRRFEFQFQIKLKKVPTGPLFLGCELEHPIKVSRWTKGLAGVLLAMIRRINSGFHYSWGTDANLKTDPVNPNDIEMGLYEKTHLSFPVEASMDRIVITKPGEEPPKLGHELYESNESVKRRRRMGAGCVDWNLEDTYTMCLWSAYCDWIQWKSLNVPGVRPFALGAVTGKQPIYLSVYELPAYTPQEYKKKKPAHYRKDLRVYTRLEFSNFEKTEGGLAENLEDIRAIKDHTRSECCSIGTESVASDDPDLEKL
ncbi:expressed unknown protein [Seminavis robusta]|uniref:Domain of unknown function at the cortex 1 domain-containing protein n=1 Tax=Seminavis robusta TaxID=568900 RepID=A0A9N8E9C0_9STRA|nr:expressed unknown protein [Seminavis robusta]|eukprot:Sro799_g204200.1 n/a (368) ;mRNA; r:45116-46219